MLEQAGGDAAEGHADPGPSEQLHAWDTVAGTAAGHKLDIYHGTASIGSIALGTAAADTVAHSDTLNEVCESMEQVSVKTGADIAGKAHVVYEYEVLHDAVQTA